MFFLGTGVLAWTIVVWNFGLAVLRRRSSVRLVFVCMSLGWPLWLLRELHLLKNWLAVPLLMSGIASGVLSAVLLVTRWVNNPRVIE